MSTPKYDDTFKAEVARLWAARDKKTQGLKYFADLLQVHRKIIYNFRYWPDPPVAAVEKAAAADAPTLDGLHERKTAESATAATDEFTTDKLITTEREALEATGRDPLIWRVKDWESRFWPTVLKLRQGQDENGRYLPEKGYVKQNRFYKIRFERIISKSQEDAYNALYARMERRAPTFRPIVRTPAADPVLAVIAIEDPHFGKLSWAAETGQDYDLKIAETDYRNAVEDLLRGAAAYNVAEILFLIGSDLAHVDSQANTTTAGTPQDVDGRYAKIVETISAAVVEAIGLAVQIAPVRALLVEGNHGRQTEYHIARYASAYFRNHPDVSIDYSMQPRKYHRYGTTLIGLAHGDKERRSELPIIMATERPKEWAETTCREWLLGHEHRSKVSHSTPVDGQSGVTVRTLRALTATDAWHHSKGYFANDRAAECYLYREDTGYVGHFLARPRKQAIQRSTAAA